MQDMHTSQLPPLTSYTHAGLYPMQSRSSKSKSSAATLGAPSRSGKHRALSRHKHSRSFSDYPYDPLRALNAPSTSDKSGVSGTVPVKPRSWNAHRLRQIVRVIVFVVFSAFEPAKKLALLCDCDFCVSEIDCIALLFPTRLYFQLRKS